MRPIELSATISLYQRLIRDEDPRTIALAIRTFKRASIDKEKLSAQYTPEQWITLEPIIDDIRALASSSAFDKNHFLDQVNLLSRHIN